MFFPAMMKYLGKRQKQYKKNEGKYFIDWLFLLFSAGINENLSRSILGVRFLFFFLPRGDKASNFISSL